MNVIIAFVVFTTVAFLFMWLMDSHDEKKKARWQKVGAEFGLELEVGGGEFSDFTRIHGEWNGISIQVESLPSNHEAVKRYFMRASIGIPARLPAGFHLEPEGFAQRFGKVLGGQDIQVGDAQLDSAFVIKGHNRDGIVELLRQPQVRSALLKARRYCRSLRIHGNEILLNQKDGNPTENQLRNYIRLCTDLVMALNQASAQMYDSPQEHEPIGRSRKALSAPATIESSIAEPPIAEPAVAESAVAEPASTDQSDWW